MSKFTPMKNFSILTQKFLYYETKVSFYTHHNMHKVEVNSVDWKTFLNGTNTLTMWYKSSGSFLRTYDSELRKIPNIIAIVPNPDSETLMTDFVKYYPTQYDTPQKARDSIKRTINLLKGLNASVYVHEGIIHYPCYVTDTQYLIGLHEFGKIDTISSPCFISQRDEFIKSQVAFLLENSSSQ